MATQLSFLYPLNSFKSHFTTVRRIKSLRSYWNQLQIINTKLITETGCVKLHSPAFRRLTSYNCLLLHLLTADLLMCLLTTKYHNKKKTQPTAKTNTTTSDTASHASPKSTQLKILIISAHMALKPTGNMRRNTVSDYCCG